MTDETLAWIIFAIMATTLIVLDLAIHRKPQRIPMKRALIETMLWISVAAVYGVFLFSQFGGDVGMEYVTAYIMEKSMSIDNLFVFIMIFALFRIPDEYQHKALFYGIFGAIVFRLIFTLVGVELMKFHFVLYVFGILLAYVAIKTLFGKEKGEGESRIAAFMSRHLRTSPTLDGDRFFTKMDAKTVATPLLLSVIVIELSDLVFALDSVPAVLALSDNLLVIYTSNIFAILGLRSLYFAIKEGLSSLRYLRYGLGALLLFIAAKLLLVDVIAIPIAISLAIIVMTLLVTIVASLLVGRASDAPEVGSRGRSQSMSLQR